MTEHCPQYGDAGADPASRHGSPAERERKTRAYVRRLCARWSEPEIRRLLKICATPAFELDPCAMPELRKNHNLDSDPLERIIRPYDFFGFHFTIRRTGGRDSRTYEIHFGCSEDTCGNGGTLTAFLEADDSLRVTDRSWWIA